jgi:hypothetical protein
MIRLFVLSLVGLVIACTETNAPDIECVGKVQVVITAIDTTVQCITPPNDTIISPPDTVWVPPDTVYLPPDTTCHWHGRDHCKRGRP